MFAPGLYILFKRKTDEKQIRLIKRCNAGILLMMKNKIKILHIINSMQPGGAEMLLANSLSQGGLCVQAENHLAYFTRSSYLLDKVDKETRIHFLDYKGGADIIRLLRQIRKIILDNKIDIVHSHLNPASWYTHLACPKQVPQVHTLHTTYSMDNETPRFNLWAEKFFYLTKKNSNLIFLSEYTQADFLKHVSFKGRGFVLNNFVPDDFFDLNIAKQQQPLLQLKLIAIGYLKPLKNFEFLLDVFSYLTNYNISLDIYGDGDKTAYEKIINEKHLKIRMMGHTQNIRDVIEGYDMFIMPSKFEGFPLSVFEAMAAGLPLMLSDIEPLRSVVKEHAVYFELDNAEKTAGRLIAVLQNETDIREMAVQARLYAEKTVRRNIYVSKLLKIYADVLQQPVN
jgi:glycosyltransferase involved in cell wall biosynthesis